jgi:hypothetical protein
MVEKDTLAHGLAVEAIARHNAVLGSAGAAAAEKWVGDSLAEPLRPFGQIGLALGLQEHDKR